MTFGVEIATNQPLMPSFTSSPPTKVIPLRYNAITHIVPSKMWATQVSKNL